MLLVRLVDAAADSKLDPETKTRLDKVEGLEGWSPELYFRNGKEYKIFKKFCYVELLKVRMISTTR